MVRSKEDCAVRLYSFMVATHETILYTFIVSIDLLPDQKYDLKIEKIIQIAIHLTIILKLSTFLELNFSV